MGSDMSNDCIGCGYCCHKAPCPVGHQLHGPEAPCPELHFAGGRHWCGWVMKQELISEERGEWAAENMHIGAGCCSSVNTWRSKPIVDRTEPNSDTQKAPMSLVEMFKEHMKQAGVGLVEYHPAAMRKEKES